MVLPVFLWMGFLIMNFSKKIFLLLFLIPLLIGGCAKSIISLETRIGLPLIQMYGLIPERNYFVESIISDSLQLLWTANANGSFTNAYPVRQGDHIFVNDLSGRIYSFELQTGKRKGQLNYRSGAIYTSPIIHKLQIIYVVTSNSSNSSKLYFYDFSKGSLLHEVEIEGRVLTDMIPLEETFFLISNDGTVYCYDYYAKEVWKVKTGIKTLSTPSFSNSILYFGNINGEIIALSALDGKQIFRREIGDSFFGGSIIADNNLFTGNDDGFLYALNTAEGNINWKYNTKARILMSPAADNENVFVGTLRGSLFSLNIKTGKFNWKVETGGTLNVTPLITQNFILLPDANRKIYFVDKLNGAIIKTLEFNGRIKMTPLLIDNLIIFGFDNYTLAAYEIIN